MLQGFVAHFCCHTFCNVTASAVSLTVKAGPVSSLSQEKGAEVMHFTLEA